jgi:CDP-diacylglycerol--glycerol-3-phosphate 3-phosphatidyltransferase
MNLPNKLTVLRVIMIPFFLIFLNINKYVALAIFIAASLTDLLDGKIARKYNLVTNFGKFMDPLADKLLVCSALVAFVELDRLPAWIVIIIIAREFIISGFRLVAADNGVVIAASYWGKWKTTFQMFMIILLIIDADAAINVTWFYWLTYIVTGVAVVLTVVSLIDYLVKNRSVMKDGGM